MKKLTSEELANISGGRFADGFCAGVGAVSVFGSFLALTGVGAVALIAANAGCAAYAISQL